MNGLGYEGAVSVSEALKANTTLLELNIASNRIPDAGVHCIAEGDSVLVSHPIVRYSVNAFYAVVVEMFFICK